MIARQLAQLSAGKDLREPSGCFLEEEIELAWRPACAAQIVAKVDPDETTSMRILGQVALGGGIGDMIDIIREDQRVGAKLGEVAGIGGIRRLIDIEGGLGANERRHDRIFFHVEIPIFI